MARFLENHDEPRAAATFSPGAHEAAAVITFLSPGLRFFHQGQFEGRRKRISPHLVRGPVEPVDQRLQQFYDRLLAVLKLPAVRDGEWQLLECRPAWDGNWTSDCFVAWLWTGTTATAGSLRSTTPRTRASVTFVCRGRIVVTVLCGLTISWGRIVSMVIQASSTRAACTWTCPHGATTRSTSQLTRGDRGHRHGRAQCGGLSVVIVMFGDGSPMGGDGLPAASKSRSSITSRTIADGCFTEWAAPRDPAVRGPHRNCFPLRHTAFGAEKKLLVITELLNIHRPHRPRLWSPHL